MGEIARSWEDVQFKGGAAGTPFIYVRCCLLSAFPAGVPVPTRDCQEFEVQGKRGPIASGRPGRSEAEKEVICAGRWPFGYRASSATSFELDEILAWNMRLLYEFTFRLCHD